MDIDLNPSLATQGTACTVRNSDHGVVKVEMSSRGRRKADVVHVPIFRVQGSSFEFHGAEQS